MIHTEYTDKYRLKCEISRPTTLEIMEEKDKKRDPMPPPDATPEEIGEFWDTHSLSDYWDETHEVDFQVNLKLRHNLVPVEREIAEQINAHATE